MDILNKLFIILLVIAFPLGEIARFEYNELTITLIDAFVGLICLTWALKQKQIPKTILIKPIFFFVGMLFLSLVLNVHRLSNFELFVSLLYLFRWIFYSLIYFVVFKITLQSKKKLESLMVICGLLVVIAGYLQYFFYPDLRNLYYLGWDEHLYRMFSTFLDPNFAGIFFVLYFLFLIDKFLHNRTFEIKNILILVLTLGAVVLTFSRSGYISLVIGMTLLFVLKRNKKMLFVFVGLFIVFVSLIIKTSLTSEGTNLLRTASNEARIDSIRNAFTIFKDNPIFGIGFNSYRYAQRDYGFVDERKKMIHSAAGTDNSFIFILVTSGIVGLLLYIFLWLKIISMNKPIIIASAIALLVNSLFINSLFYPSLMLWMWILIGIKENS